MVANHKSQEIASDHQKSPYVLLLWFSKWESIEMKLALHLQKKQLIFFLRKSNSIRQKMVKITTLLQKQFNLNFHKKISTLSKSP